MGVRRLAAVLLTGPLLLAAVACGGHPDSSSRGTRTPSPSDSSTPSPTTSPTTSPSNVTGVGGRLLLVPADAPGKLGRCTPAPRDGVVCSPDRRTTYRFQPDAVRTLAVSTSLASQVDTGGTTAWVIQIRVGPAATRTLTALTTTAARTRQQLLVLLPGSRRLLTAPQVNQPITTGDLQISGDFTQASAASIVRQITSTAG